ncbi:MAG: putative baseplate assembly protein [Acidobacteriota bacterium]
MGTHASFLETMQARLSSSDFMALEGLTTRDAADPSLALLDAWALVGDVLTFYQERIANEGYLRTSTERRSVLELARLVGYEPRPGVAASTYLAYLLDEGPEALIPAGAAARSVPGPGELPQTFETMEDLTACAAWNNLQVRLTRPQNAITTENDRGRGVYLQGVNTQVKVNDPLLIGPKGRPDLYRVVMVEPDALKDRTRVTVQPWLRTVPQAPPPPPAIDFIKLDLSNLQSRKLPANTPPRVISGLKAIEAKDPLKINESELRVLMQEAQSGLEKGPSTKVAAWLMSVIANLQEALQSDLFKERSVASASPAIPSSVLIDQLAKPPKPQNRSSAQLDRSSQELFQPGSDVNGKLLASSRPELRGMLYTAWANAPATALPDFEVHALRVRASVFGHNAPRKLTSSKPDDQGVILFTQGDDRPLEEVDKFDPSNPDPDGLSRIVWLDAPYPQIRPESWVVFHRPSVTERIKEPLIIARVRETAERSREAYGIAAKSTRLAVNKPWLDLNSNDEEEPEDSFDVIRGTAIFAQSELLPLAEAPIDPVEEAVGGGEIELARFYDGLMTGRWLIVSGERTDVREIDFDGKEQVVPGIKASELMMLAGVKHGVSTIDSLPGSDTVPEKPRPKRPLPGDRTHTTLTLAKELQYRYKRDTVVIYGNVAKATHGETRFEVMGSGDASKSLQSFTLKQPPLTYVSAPTPSGVESTLKMRVNDLLWHEADSLVGLQKTDRSYIVRIDAGGQTTVVFGNGERGARLPTGPENVRATYRNGIGKGGNVKKEQITQLATRPLGVKDVINPLPATGGADKESRDQARRNAPLAVLALDRLVSVQDYEDFTRTFAGIGKARATLLSDGFAELVHVTIAGEDDIPIGTDSELLQNLEAALRLYGDPRQALLIDVRERSFLIVEAEVRVLPDYLWEKVEPKIRAAMLQAFGFDRSDLGQDAVLSEAYRAIQRVPGVDFVDVNVFTTRDPEDLLAETDLKDQPKKRLRASLAAIDDDGTIHPAQLLYLSSEVADTLILKELKS